MGRSSKQHTPIVVLVALVALFGTVFLYFVRENQASLTSQVADLTKERKELTRQVTSADAACEKKLGAVRQDLHYVQQSLELCKKRHDSHRAAKDISNDSLYALMVHFGMPHAAQAANSKPSIGIGVEDDVSPDAVVSFIKEKFLALSTSEHGSATRASNCEASRKKAEGELQTRLKLAEDDLHTRLNNLQRAREKIQRLEKEKETLQSEKDEYQAETLRLRKLVDNHASAWHKQADAISQLADQSKIVDSLKQDLQECRQERLKQAIDQKKPESARRP